MAADLIIVDFPHQRKSRRVQFAETAQLHIYQRNNVARHELCYTASEYDLMKLVVSEDVLDVRAARTSNEAVDDDASSKESACFIGIEHLLAPACRDEVRDCRARCIRAVLAEQSGQGPSARFGWEAIATYCACLDRSDKAAHGESKEARRASPRITLRALVDYFRDVVSIHKSSFRI